MVFNREQWQVQVHTWWIRNGHRFKDTSIESAYAVLAASTWVPFLAFYAADRDSAVQVLAAITAGIGSSLLANLAQGVYDHTLDDDLIADQITRQACTDSQIRAEIEAVFAAARVLEAAREAMGEEWSQDLALQYRQERAALDTQSPIPSGLTMPPPAHTITIQAYSILLPDWQEHLLQQLGQEYDEILIEREHTEGYSDTRVLRIWPSQSGQSRPRHVVKLGPTQELYREYANYTAHVESLELSCGARIDAFCEQNGKAALDYVAIGGGTWGEVRTLEEHYHDACPDNPSLVIRALDLLLEQRLGEAWYSSQISSPPCFYASEYSRHIVEHVRLRLDAKKPDGIWLQGSPLPPARRPRYTAVTPADILHDYREMRTRERLEIEGLIVEKIKGGVVKLRDIDGKGIVVRVEPGEKRGIPPNLNPGNQVIARGTVIYNRYSRLQEIARKVLPDLTFSADDKVIEKPDRLCGYPNPLEAYPKVLAMAFKAARTRVHGDLHLRNILVDENNRGWLIDFARVEIRHSIFDFIKLETYIRQMGIARGDHTVSLANYVQFEECLANTDPTQGNQAARLNDPYLQFAYEVIMAIRRVAARCIGAEHDFGQEYLPPLFLYCLAVAKYYDDSRSETHEPARLSFVTSTVLSRYLPKVGDWASLPPGQIGIDDLCRQWGLFDSSTSRRFEAAVKLYGLKSRCTMPILASRLGTEPDPTIRHWLALALGQIGGQEAKRILEKAQASEQDSWAQKGIGGGLAAISSSTASKKRCRVKKGVK